MATTKLRRWSPTSVTPPTVKYRIELPTMWPTLYTQHTEFADVPYNSWGLMITFAFIAAVVITHRRAPKVGIDPDRLVGFYVMCIVCGLTGARLQHFLMATPEQFWARPSDFFRLTRGGFTYLGGVIGGATGGITYAAIRGLPVLKLSDVVGPSLLLALGMGRIGCFLAGCCHGKPLTLPPDATPLLPTDFSGGQIWVFDSFPFLAELTHKGVGHNDVVVYPTQLWEMVVCFVIFGIGSWLWYNFRKFDGQIVATVLLLYCAWRPINEMMRGDEVRGTDWFGLTTAQVTVIPLAVLCVIVLIVGFFLGLKPETPFVPASDEEIIEGSAPKL